MKTRPLVCNNGFQNALGALLRRQSTLTSRYKDVLSRHPSPLAIITASCEAESHAATVSSLASLSVAEPGLPLLSFNLRLPSTTSRLIHKSGRFSVNLLAGVPGADQVARRFAAMASDVELDWFPRSPEPYNTPMLNQSSVSGSGPDRGEYSLAYARLDCVARHCFPVRDHEIWVGEVERIEESEGSSPGLVYFNKEFEHVQNITKNISMDLKKHHLRHK